MTTVRQDQGESWEQLSLIPGGVIEVTLKIGVMPDDDHCQFQLSVEDPSTGELLALSSRPHASLTRLPDELSDWAAMAVAITLEHVAPF